MYCSHMFCGFGTLLKHTVQLHSPQGQNTFYVHLHTIWYQPIRHLYTATQKNTRKGLIWENHIMCNKLLVGATVSRQRTESPPRVVVQCDNKFNSHAYNRICSPSAVSIIRRHSGYVVGVQRDALLVCDFSSSHADLLILSLSFFWFQYFFE